MQRCSFKSITSLIILTLLAVLSIHYQAALLGISTEPLQPAKEIADKNSYLSLTIPTSEFRDYSYIHTAFRVSHSEIRITFIRSFKKHEPVYYRYGNSRGIVRFECVLPSCLDAFSKPCNMIGYVGIVREPVDLSANTIEFSTKDMDSADVSVEILDVQVKSDTYPHQLGVCLQPIYLHADYVLFIQFFEFWISQGATKFYIYKESYTSEVQKVIEFYNQTGSVDIEVIDWSLLPSFPDTGFSTNPNAYVYRLEMMLSIFDCVHRSRSNAKFVAQTDLDEIIFIKNEMTVAEFMEDYSQNEPMLSSVSFQSQRISFEESKFQQINSPLDVNFSIFEEVKLEDYVFDRPFYSKLIYRPERVFRVHSHQQFTPEKIPKRSTRYQNKLINSTDGVVFHMRRSADTFSWKNTTTSDVLKPLSLQLVGAYSERIANYDFGPSRWINIGVKVVREVDACRKMAYKNKHKRCHNVLVCEESLSKKHAEAFIHSNNSWYFV